MNKVIALDIGNVCLEIRHERTLNYLGRSSIEEVPENFMIKIDLLERGLISNTGWLAEFQKITENKFTDDELIHAWNLSIGEPLEGMEALITEITEAGYKFVFFSDTSELHITRVYDSLPFAHLVSGRIFSYEVGAKKPENKMYEAFEKLYGKPCFYLDDKPENIEAGKKHGWKSHLFKNAGNFRKDFFLNSYSQ